MRSVESWILQIRCSGLFLPLTQFATHVTQMGLNIGWENAQRHHRNRKDTFCYYRCMDLSDITCHILFDTEMYQVSFIVDMVRGCMDPCNNQLDQKAARILDDLVL
jgi:hypothetical protein